MVHRGARRFIKRGWEGRSPVTESGGGGGLSESVGCVPPLEEKDQTNQS